MQFREPSAVASSSSLCWVVQSPTALLFDCVDLSPRQRLAFVSATSSVSMAMLLSTLQAPWGILTESPAGLISGQYEVRLDLRRLTPLLVGQQLNPRQVTCSKYGSFYCQVSTLHKCAREKVLYGNGMLYLSAELSGQRSCVGV